MKITKTLIVSCFLLIITSCSKSDDSTDKSEEFVELGTPEATLTILDGPLEGSYSFPNPVITREANFYFATFGNHEGQEQSLTFNIAFTSSYYPLNETITYSLTNVRIDNLDVTVEHPNYASNTFSQTVTRKALLLDGASNDYVMDISFESNMTDGVTGLQFNIEGSYTNMLFENCNNCAD